MTLLTRNHLAQQDTFRSTEVDVSEWGTLNPETGEREKTTVFVRELNARERDAFEHSCMQGKGKKQEFSTRGMQVKLVIMCACDAEGNRIFGESDTDMLFNKSSKVVYRIYKAALELNGLSNEDEEELLKN